MSPAAELRQLGDAAERVALRAWAGSLTDSPTRMPLDPFARNFYALARLLDRCAASAERCGALEAPTVELLEDAA